MSIMAFMSADHDRLEGLFSDYEKMKGPAMRKAERKFGEFREGLERHIIWEEDILFPIFEERTGMRASGPTEVMRNEHLQIRRYLAAIHDLLRAGDGRTDELERSLFAVLGGHNSKEENVLYPWIDSTLSETEMRSVFERMGVPRQGAGR